MTDQTEPRGLYKKYQVTKIEGDTDPNALYFVLRLDTDHAARVAAISYANRVADENPTLAKDLYEVCIACAQTPAQRRELEKFQVLMMMKTHPI